MFFSAPCSQVSSACDLPLKLRVQASHPYKTTGKIIVSCILIFIFSDRRQEYKDSEVNVSMQNSICP
jgi:hypothetical protein